MTQVPTNPPEPQTKSSARLRSAYARMIWVGIGLGVIAGMGAGILTGLRWGSANPFIVAVGGGLFGAVAAAIGGGLALLAVAAVAELKFSSAVWRVGAAALAGGVGVASIWAWAFAALRSSPPWAALFIGMFASGCAAALAVRAERQAVHARPTRSRAHIPGTAVLWPLLGGPLAVLAGGFTISLLREQLHFACGVGAPGTEGDGSWTCADGISYLGPAVVLGGMTMLAVVVAALVAGLVRNDRAARWWLVGLAAFIVGWIVTWTWVGSSNYVRATPPGIEPEQYWFAAVLPATLVAAASLIVACVAIALCRRPSTTMLWVAAGGLGVASVLQPGLALATLPAACFVIGAIMRAGAPSDPRPGAAPPHQR